MDSKFSSPQLKNYIQKTQTFMKEIDNQMNGYISEKIQKEYKPEEVFIALQDKIKNIKNYDFVSGCFKDIIENKREVLLYCDYDNDGLSAGTEMSYFLEMFDVPYTIVFSDRKNDGYGLKVENLTTNAGLKTFLENHTDSKKPVYVCTLDNGINNDEVNSILADAGITYCSIDHHQPNGIDSNSYCCNPHLNKENISVEENLCTGLLVYGFCLTMFKDQAKKKEFLYNNLDLAILSTLSDYMKLDGLNRGIVRHFSNEVLVRGRKQVREMIELNDFFKKQRIWDTLNGTVVSLLNAVGRMENMEKAYNFMKISPSNKKDAGNLNNTLLTDLVEINEKKKKLVEVAVKKISENFDEYLDTKNYPESKVFIYNDSETHLGIASILSTQIAIKNGTVTLIGHTHGLDKIRYSIRSPFYNQILGEDFASIGYKFKGHNVAGVVEIDITEKEEFEKKTRELFNKKSMLKDPLFVLTTITDGDLISSELLDKIYSYGPYGAYLKEPVFEIIGEFQKQANQLFIGASTSGKTQVMKYKVGNKEFRAENLTGKPFTEEDIRNTKSIIAKIDYPYPNQNKNIIKILEIRK